MFIEIAAILFVVNMVFFLRPLILSRILYKKITFFGTLKRLIIFLLKIPIEFLRIIFLNKLKYTINTKENDIFQELYNYQLMKIGFGNKKLGIIINISSQFLMFLFFILGILNL